ncbi:MAG: hypothetical protein H0W84_01385 [Bacteroidetes bacterium]|nr:hypothetical protein [Bacteroidota bacterium]
MLDALRFDFSNRTQLRINISINYRSGGTTQQYRIVKVANDLKIAFQTSSGEFTENRIPKDFPDYDPNNPQKIFD